MVTAQQIEERPVFRSGEVYEAVPGVVISQHSGEGKANQYYVRGFNIDHGTDLATWVAGAPVNMPTHAHGQGYSDNNFLIPELVSGVQYQKGTYSAEEGDFSAAGAINVNYLNVLDQRIVKVEGGQDRFGRVLLAASSSSEAATSSTPARPTTTTVRGCARDDYRKLNGVLRFSQGDQQNGFSLTAMAYYGRWNSTDQVPRAGRRRAGSSTASAPSIPPTPGSTHRYTLGRRMAQEHGRGPDPRQGLRDRLRPRPVLELHLLPRRSRERRPVRAGGRARHRGRQREPALPRPLVRQGHRERRRLPGTLRPHPDPRPLPHRGAAAARTRSARIGSTSRAAPSSSRRASSGRPSCGRWRAFGATSTTSTWRATIPRTPGRRSASLASPKLSLILGPWKNTEVYANWGCGFHSNDARGSVQTRDPKTGEPVPPVDPIVRAKGAEVGVRTRGPRTASTAPLTGWMLDIASELRLRRRRRHDRGQPAEPAGRLRVVERLHARRRGSRLDADLAYSKARFRDDDPAGDRIPGAVEGVASAGVTVDGRARFRAACACATSARGR